MNYIKKLQEIVESHRTTNAVAKEQLADLSRYLLSNKFNCGSELDGYVHVRDVLAYIDRLRGELDAAELSAE